jgi:hypothetical protein
MEIKTIYDVTTGRSRETSDGQQHWSPFLFHMQQKEQQPNEKNGKA